MAINQNQLRELVKRAQKFQKEADDNGYGRRREPVVTQYPHCDQRILHAPNECEYCDMYPQWQQLREVWNINFTGHYDVGKAVCPAEKERGLGRVNEWSGNQPTVHMIQEEPDAGN